MKDALRRIIRRFTIAAAATATVLFAAPASASLIFVPNGDFQNPVKEDDGFTFASTTPIDTTTIPATKPV